ncbi:hypothetical protein CVT24_009188 [Panaeolus cyanescens]|uniref:USP domain-containing protein n=1 Tax=Panaeolus cyanescens TaxID=181874 RepID=A0A409Y8E6_9AGAR|nr:hypothetical protein CVT24_009188 [Panaeolus cyanescens]
MQLTSEQQQLEQEHVDHLASIIQVSPELARKALRKHKGDMEKAADALLAGFTGDEPTANWDKQRRNTPEPSSSNAVTVHVPTLPPVSNNTPVASNNVIDLTGEDDMTRALQMSIEDSTHSGTMFGPSDRAPNPDWQMDQITSDGAISSEDKSLSDAIQASLASIQDSDMDTLPAVPAMREPGRPIALRAESPGLAYAALVLQALFFVPQVRSAVANLRVPHVDVTMPLEHPDRAMVNLIELYTNLDLATLAWLVDESVLPSLHITPLSPQHNLGESSGDVVNALGSLIEDHTKAQLPEGEDPDRLFSFKHGRVTIYNDGRGPVFETPKETGMVVNISSGQPDSANDLISAITQCLSSYTEEASMHEVIITPSEVIGFNLRRGARSSVSKSSLDPFSYPKTLYLDRFMFDSLQLTTEKHEQERRLNEKIQDLMRTRRTLVTNNNRDAMKDLKSSIYYFEHAALSDGDPVRQASIQRTLAELQTILTTIQGKVEGKSLLTLKQMHLLTDGLSEIDHQLEQYQADVAKIYDCPELQNFRYDLRAVLFHTGLPGRKQIYSYVQDIEGTWWKTTDHEVTEVPEETVLNDPTGLHLGAGPYLLLYSRHMSDEMLHEPLVWPSSFSEAVTENNNKFFAMMHPELELYGESPPAMRGLTPAPTDRPGERLFSRTPLIMVSADNLNLDVLELIFEYLSGNDLPAVALVSRSFLADIRAVPIATPTKRLHSKFAHESVQALKLCKNLRSFRCIVPTMFQLYLPALQGKSQLETLWTDGKLSQSQSQRLLKITKLNSLRLDGTTWNVVDLLPTWTKTISNSLNELIFYMIADLNEGILKSIFEEVPHLTSLHVVACAKVNHVTLLRIASPLTRLESLSFTVTENTSSLAQPPPSFQRLKHLSLDAHYNSAPSPSPTILSSVLSYLKFSTPPLVSFTLKLPERKVQVGDPFIKQLVDCHGHTLRRLAFFDCGISQNSLIEICKSCIQLDRLEVSVPMKELGSFIKNLGKSKTLHTLEDLENHVDHGVQTPLTKENIRTMMTRCPSLRRVLTKHRIWIGVSG